MMSEQTFSPEHARELVLFSRQLATLLDAGIALPWAFRLLREEAPARYADACAEFQVRAFKGEQLNSMMRSTLFPPFLSEQLRYSCWWKVETPAQALRKAAALLAPVGQGNAATMVGDAQSISAHLELYMFFLHESALFRAGWNLRAAISRVGWDSTLPMAEVARDLADKIGQGTSLAEALATRPDVFSPFTVAVTRLGELSGRTDDAWAFLADMLEEAWADAPLTGWEPEQVTPVLPQAAPLSGDWQELTRPRQLLLLRWLCRLGALDGAAKDDQELLRATLRAAAYLLPANQRDAVQEMAESEVVGDLHESLGKLGALPEYVTRYLPGGQPTYAAALAGYFSGELHGQGQVETLAHFYRQFNTLIENGASIVAALYIIEQGTPSPYAAAAARLRKMIEGGSTVWQAMASLPEQFPPVFTGLLRMSEEIGVLDLIVGEIADLHDTMGSGENCSPSTEQLLSLRILTRQLGIGINAGMQLGRILASLREHAPEPFKEAMADIYDQVMQQSQTMSAGMQRHTHLFSPLYLTLIRNGEVGGMLDVAATLLSEMMEDEWKFSPATGWRMPEASLFLPDTTTMPEHWHELSGKQQKLLLYWACRLARTTHLLACGTALGASRDRPPLPPVTARCPVGADKYRDGQRPGRTIARVELPSASDYLDGGNRRADQSTGPDVE